MLVEASEPKSREVAKITGIREFYQEIKDLADMTLPANLPPIKHPTMVFEAFVQPEEKGGKPGHILIVTEKHAHDSFEIYFDQDDSSLKKDLSVRIPNERRISKLVKHLYKRVSVPVLFERIRKAAEALIGTSPVLYEQWLSCKHVFSTKVKTASVYWSKSLQRHVISINPQFAIRATIEWLLSGHEHSNLKYMEKKKVGFEESLSQMTLFLMAHELGHVTQRHTSKKTGLYGEFSGKKVNVYGDALINLRLFKSLFGKMHPSLALPGTISNELYFEGDYASASEFVESVVKVFKSYGSVKEEGDRFLFQDGPARVLASMCPMGFIRHGASTGSLIKLFEALRDSTGLDKLIPKEPESVLPQKPPPEPALKVGQVVVIDETGEQGIVVEAGPVKSRRTGLQDVKILPLSAASPELRESIRKTVESGSNDPLSSANANIVSGLTEALIMESGEGGPEPVLVYPGDDTRSDRAKALTNHSVTPIYHKPPKPPKKEDDPFEGQKAAPSAKYDYFVPGQVVLYTAGGKNFRAVVREVGDLDEEGIQKVTIVPLKKLPPKLRQKVLDAIQKAGINESYSETTQLILEEMGPRPLLLDPALFRPFKGIKTINANLNGYFRREPDLGSGGEGKSQGQGPKRIQPKSASEEDESGEGPGKGEGEDEQSSGGRFDIDDQDSGDDDGGAGGASPEDEEEDLGPRTGSEGPGAGKPSKGRPPKGKPPKGEPSKGEPSKGEPFKGEPSKGDDFDNVDDLGDDDGSDGQGTGNDINDDDLGDLGGDGSGDVQDDTEPEEEDTGEGSFGEPGDDGKDDFDKFSNSKREQQRKIEDYKSDDEDDSEEAEEDINDPDREAVFDEAIKKAIERMEEQQGDDQENIIERLSEELGIDAEQVKAFFPKVGLVRSTLSRWEELLREKILKARGIREKYNPVSPSRKYVGQFGRTEEKRSMAKVWISVDKSPTMEHRFDKVVQQLFVVFNDFPKLFSNAAISVVVWSGASKIDFRTFRGVNTATFKSIHDSINPSWRGDSTNFAAGVLKMDSSAMGPPDVYIIMTDGEFNDGRELELKAKTRLLAHAGKIIWVFPGPPSGTAIVEVSAMDLAWKTRSVIAPSTR